MKSIPFIKSESETSPFNNNNNINNKEKNDKNNNTNLGVEIAQLYDSIISTPSSSTAVKSKPNPSISFIKDNNNNTKKIKEDIYCDICDMKVKDPYHFQGTAHLVSSQREITSTTPASSSSSSPSSSSSSPTTIITRLEIEHGQDLALQLMKKHGWQHGQGLGKHNQGLKYPVTATWKQDRLGLGHPNTIKKKITNKSILQPSPILQQPQQQMNAKQLAANAKADSASRSAMLRYMNN